MNELPQPPIDIEKKSSRLKRMVEGTISYARDALARIRNIHLETDEKESEEVLKRLEETRTALVDAESILSQEEEIEKAASEIVDNDSHKILLQDHLVTLRDAANEFERTVQGASSDYLDWQIAGKYREREAVLEASMNVVACLRDIMALERKIAEKHEPYEKTRYYLAMSISAWAQSRGGSLYNDIQSMPDEYKQILSTTTIGTTQQSEKLLQLLSDKFAQVMAQKESEASWQTLTEDARASETKLQWDIITSGMPFLAASKDLSNEVFLNLIYIRTGGLDEASVDRQALVQKKREMMQAQEILETLIPDSAAYSRILANINTVSRTVLELPNTQAEAMQKTIAYLQVVAERLGNLQRELAGAEAEKQSALDATFSQESPIVEEIKAEVARQGVSQEIIDVVFVENATPRSLMRDIEAQEKKHTELRRKAIEIYTAEQSVREFAERMGNIFINASDMYSRSTDLIGRIRALRERKSVLGDDSSVDALALDGENGALTGEYGGLVKDAASIANQMLAEFMNLSESIRQEIESQKDAWDYFPWDGSVFNHALDGIRIKLSRIQKADNLNNGLLPLISEVFIDLAETALSAKKAGIGLARHKSQQLEEMDKALREISRTRKYRNIVKPIVIGHEAELEMVRHKRDSAASGISVIERTLSRSDENTKVSDIVDVFVANTILPLEAI